MSVRDFRCPTCDKPVKPPGDGPGEKVKFFPFCSERCRLIDLGGWFDERYAIVSELPCQDLAEGPQRE